MAECRDREVFRMSRFFVTFAVLSAVAAAVMRCRGGYPIGCDLAKYLTLILNQT